MSKAVDMLFLFGKALGAVPRAKVVVALCEEEGLLTVGELAERAGLSLAATSHHVGLLAALGFVRLRAEGRTKVVLVVPEVEGVLKAAVTWARGTEDEEVFEGEEVEEVEGVRNG